MTRFLENKKLVEMSKEMADAITWICEHPKINRDSFDESPLWDSESHFVRAAINNFLFREGGPEYRKWLKNKQQPKGDIYATRTNDLYVRHRGQDVSDSEKLDLVQ